MMLREINIEKLMFYLIGLGVFIIAVSVLMLMLSILKKREFSYRPEKRNKSILLRKVKRLLSQIKLSIKELSKGELVIVFIVGILIALTTKDMRELPKLFTMSMFISFGIIKVIKKIKKQAARAGKLKEAAVLFEAVELYCKAGYTLYQALNAAKLLTRKIRPDIERCLNYWGAGAKKALKNLQEELNLPEAQTLILLLMHLESAGVKDLENILKREAYNVEEMQHLKTELKLKNRPLILMVYRFLPLFSVLGIVLGSLLYRTFNVMRESGIWKF